MVTQVQFGNVFSSGGRQVLGGSATGYDTESLVNGLTKAKRQPAAKLEDKIKSNTEKQAAFADMKGILDRFRDAANFLRNPPGVSNNGEDIFNYRKGALSSNSGVAASNYLATTIEPGASLSNYAITVDSLATYNLQTTTTFAAADLTSSVVGGTGPFNAGSWSIGPNANVITLTAGDTLQDFINKANAISDTSEVQVSAIQVSTGQYRLQFKTTATGAANNYALPAGMFNGIGLAINQSAVDAQMTVDGTPITRSSNTIDNVVDGVTFDLLQTTPPATQLTLDVQPDAEVVKNGILNFVDSYNELRLFVSRQTEIGDDGKPKKTAILSNSSSVRNTMTSITAEMSRVVDGLTTDPNRLSALGITFGDYPGDTKDPATPFTRNIMVVDEDILDSALAANFDAARKVFEFDFNSSDSDIQVFRRTNALDVSAFTLNIDPSTGVYQATYNSGSGSVTTNLTGSAIAGGGYLIEGPKGTPFEGLQMIYSGSTATTSTVNLSQGIGDRVYNSLNDLLDEKTGAVTVEISSLADSDKRMQDEITRIDRVVDRYREQLLQKFADLEKAVSSVNTILKSLDANTNAQNNS